MINKSLFTGYGFYIQETEDANYYWDCFSDEEKVQIFEDKHNFVHLLNDREMFIGWRFDRKLSKDAFIWTVKYSTENFWNQWDENFGDVKRPAGEPYFQSFMYEQVVAGKRLYWTL